MPRPTLALAEIVNPPTQTPLWAILVIPFTIIIIAVISLTSYLAHQNSQAVVDDIAIESIDEINARINGHLDTYLNTPLLINQSNANLFRNGLLDANNPDQLGHYFWEEIQIYESVTSIYFGNPQGGLVTGGREALDDSFYKMVTDNFQAGHLTKYAMNAVGQPTVIIDAVPVSDARGRPWYVEAIAQRDINWIDPYVLSTGQGLAIASSLSIYDDSDTLIGVVSVDIFLSDISNFLQGLRIGKTGQTYIIDHTGLLVATSTASPTFVKNNDGQLKRVPATTSQDSLIAQSARYLTTEFGDFSHLEKPHRETITIYGVDHYLQVIPYHEFPDIDWLIVTVIPEDDFLADIKTQNRVNVLLTVVAVAVAILVSIGTALQVTRPIERLSKVATEIANGNLNQAVTIEGVAEIRRLGQSFNMMSTQLHKSFTDLEERVQERTAELSISETRYRGIVEDQTELICRYLPDTTLLFVNEAYCRYHEMTTDQLIGKKLLDFIVESERSRLKQKLESLSTTNTTRTSDHHYWTSNGELRWLQWVDRALYDDNNQLVEFQAVGRDITEQKLYEEMLQKSLAREIELNEMKSHFISTVSHEFRTPLTIIMNSSQMLERYADRVSEESQAEHFGRIKRQIARMTSLLEDILTINRSNLGKWEFNPQEIDLVALCQIIIAEIKIANESKLNFEFTAQDNCQAVVADKKLVQLIMDNLISNAVKYSDEGKIIKIDLQCMEDAIIFKVADEGIGIPENLQSRIFEPFYRANNVKTIQGTGLGLSIVKQSVEQHGGTISFESKVDSGTIFTVQLPVVPKKDEIDEENSSY